MFPFIARKQIEHLIKSKKSRPNKCFCDYNSIKSVILLIEQNDYDALLPFFDELRNNKISFLSFIENKNKNIVHKPESNEIVYGKNELTFFDLPKASLLKSMNKHQADVLIDLSLKENLSFIYLTYKSTCKFKLGLKKKIFNPYDMMIDSKTHISALELANMLLFYLKNIETKDINL